MIAQQTNNNRAMLGIGLIVLIVIGIIGLLSIVTVPAGRIGVMLQWGGITNTSLNQGIHFIVPIEQSVALMNTQTLLYSANESSSSKDLQDVYTEIGVNYRINPADANKIYNQYGLYYPDTIIAPAVASVVKAVTAQYNASDLIDERSAVQYAIQQQLYTRLGDYDLIVQNVSITNFAFSPQYSAAIEAKVVAQQQLQQQLINLSITRVKANQTVAAANGTARAIATINDALAQNPLYLKYFVLSKWNGQLPFVLGSGSMPLINLQSLGSYNVSETNSSLLSNTIP
jgi:regulator of protease activity HflC (stomatin/prohibitin superfamily)